MNVDANNNKSNNDNLFESIAIERERIFRKSEIALSSAMHSLG